MTRQAGCYVRAVLRLALTNVAAHYAGLLGAAFLIGPGAPHFEREQRLRYLTEHTMRWSLGWSVWIACAFVMVAFMIALARRSRGRSGVVALSLAILAAVCDVAAEIAQITWLPDLARNGDVAAFLHAERFVGVIGTVVANGLYSVAVLVASLGLRSRSVVTLGIATFAAGAWMATAGATGAMNQVASSAGATIISYCAWTVAVARHVDGTSQPG